MSSLERSISSSTNPEYSCSASLQSVVSSRVVGMVAGCPCVSLPGSVVSCRFSDKPVCSGSCTACGCTGVARAEGGAPVDALLLPLAVLLATDCRVSPGGRFREHAHLSLGIKQVVQICSIASWLSPLSVSMCRVSPLVPSVHVAASVPMLCLSILLSAMATHGARLGRTEWEAAYLWPPKMARS